MNQIDERWQSSDPEVENSVAFNLINNPSSDILRSIMDADQKSESQFKYAEIFVTNQYGANIAFVNNHTRHQIIDKMMRCGGKKLNKMEYFYRKEDLMKVQEYMQVIVRILDVEG